MGRTIAAAVALAGCCILWLSLAHAQSPDGEKIDWDRAKRIYQRMQSGETLTADDRAYLERAKQARQKQQAQQPGSPRGAVPKPPVGLKPLSDMSAEDRYKGEDGGLYGGGKNAPPEKHLTAAFAQARLIRPLDRNGKPDAHGKIVLISVGMSNTTQEFSQFVRLAEADREKSPQLAIVDGAQGGIDARGWAEADNSRPGRNPWSVLDERLRGAGVTAEQVQAAWLKQARMNPASLGEFPKHTQELKGHLVTILHQLKERFPNLRIVYLSSRIYAGYAASPLNPEPYAYESAFAVRLLIQEQMKGDAALAFDSREATKAPLVLWGPYLWADGEKGRKTDDLVWKLEDFGGDGTHPSASGQRKVAELLLKFMKSDPTAKTWFRDSGLGTRDP